MVKMENGFKEEGDREGPRSGSSLNTVDPGKPASLSWQHQLNFTGKTPVEFDLTIREIMPVPTFDFSTKLSCHHGIPLGGIGVRSIGRSYRGEFQRFQFFYGACEENPVLANQFSVFVSRPNGEKVLTVLCSTSPEKAKTMDSGIEAWDWNLNGEKCRYHALFSRAWTIYEGQPDPDLKSFPDNFHLSFLIITRRAVSLWPSLHSHYSIVEGLLQMSLYSLHGLEKDGVHGVLLHHKTSNGRPPVTFASAAQESDDVHVSLCPCFTISGEDQALTAKEAWFV